MQSQPHEWPVDLPGRVGPGARAERLGCALGTWFLFATFGAGALVLAGVILPSLALFGRASGKPDLRAQRMIHRSFRAFVRLGTAIRVFRLSESRTDRLLERGGLVVANHPTLLDVVFLISRLPQADCIVKRAAWRNPFLRGIVRAAGYIPNDEGEALVRACTERLRAGRTLVLFPEGSRSPGSGLGPFKRGAARIALASGCPITPVLIRCEPPALNKGGRDYLPQRPLEFSLAVGEPLAARELAGADESPAVAARQITRQLRSYFEARLDHGNA